MHSIHFIIPVTFSELLKLQRNIDKYQLLRHASATEDDRSNFTYTKRSLELLGIGADETLAVFQVLAAILKLGNLVFVPATHIDGTEGCTVTNDYELEDAAELLQIDARTLLNCMTTRRVPDEYHHRHYQHADTSSSTSSASPPVAAVAVAADRQRALLCRTLYGRLFAWLVHRINKALKAPVRLRATQRQRGKRLGVLDLCGFETTAASGRGGGGGGGSAAVASFEQLCINYADERLHQHYVRTVIRHQTELYAREGLELAPIACFDNASTCELLDRPKFGLLALLDEPHVQQCPNGAAALAARLRQCCAGHPSFVCGEGRGEEHRSGATTALAMTAGSMTGDAAATAKPMVAFQ